MSNPHIYTAVQLHPTDPNGDIGIVSARMTFDGGCKFIAMAQVSRNDEPKLSYSVPGCLADMAAITWLLKEFAQQVNDIQRKLPGYRRLAEEAALHLAYLMRPTNR